MTRKIVALAAALGIAAVPAFATMTMKAPDAQMHYKAIANANLADIMAEYAPGATLDWVGGPLNGTYTGDAAIKGVWTKFILNETTTTEMASNIQVDGVGKLMTVTADVTFKGMKTVPVRYILVFDGKKITNEIWQVSGKMTKM